MEKRRSSRKSGERSKSKKLFETVDPMSEDENEIENFYSNPTRGEMNPYVLLIRNADIMNSECFDHKNQKIAASGILLEVNNNTELVDRNLTDSNVNVPPPTNEYDENGEQNWSSEKTDFCKKLRRFLKKSINMAENLDDNGFIDFLKKKKLYSLCREAAKLHKTGSLRSLSFDKMEYVFGILNKIMSNGNELIVSYTEDNRYALNGRSDPVFKAMYACLLELYIWTTPAIDKKLVNDDGVENVTIFLKLCMQNIIFPAFNTSYQENSGSKETNSKKEMAGNTKTKKVEGKELQLYNDLTEAVELLKTFLRDQTLIDTHILRIDSFSISAFFVNKTENIQLALLKLVECVFSKYKNHRKALLDDILHSLEKHSVDRKQYGAYKLETGGKIQMYTALVMKMIQSVVHFSSDLLKQDEIDFKVIAAEQINDACKAAHHFMLSLFNMCCSNTNEGCRAIIVSFVKDLLVTVDRPEWPAAEMLLNMLVFTLIENYSASQQKKIFSLELLTTVYSDLYRKTVQHKENMHKIDQLFENMQPTVEPGKKCEKLQLDDSTKVEFLQNALLDFIARRESTEPGLLYARHLHLAYWYIERAKSQNNSKQLVEKILAEKKKSIAGKSRKTSKGKSPAKKSSAGAGLSQNNSNMQMLLEKFHSKTVDSLNMNVVADEATNLFIDADAAQLITHNFGLKRPLHLRFKIYLSLLLNGLKETSTPVRLKAMRCLSHITVAAPELLSLNNVESAVKFAIYDHSIAIRESAIDIISKIALSKSDMDDCHVTVLSERILDTGVSVRKKVIKTLGDLCLKFPALEMTPEIAAKIMRRINDDEPGVHNMVLEFFYKLWFQPIDAVTEPELANQRILSIINVMNNCVTNNGVGAQLGSFETLLRSLMNPNEDACDKRGMKNMSAEDVIEVCKEIVQGLMRNLSDVPHDKTNLHRHLCVMASIYLFAKIKPNLVVRHIDTLQKLLSVTCLTPNSQLIIYILHTIEFAIPLIKHVNEELLIALESNFENIIMIQERTVIQSCIPCIRTFAEKLTHNFKFVASLMKKYFDQLANFSTYIEKRKFLGNKGCDVSTDVNQLLRRNSLKRAFFVVGLFMRYFNFCEKAVCCEIVPLTITSDVVLVLDSFMRSEDVELQLHAVMTIGNVCIRYCKLMLTDGMKGHYCYFLTNPHGANDLKVQVLQNLISFLENDCQRTVAQYNEWKERCENESLKLLEDVASGFSSSVIQLFLQEILALTVHMHFVVRHAAQKLTLIIYQQGLVNPVQLVPYLIAMSTEDEPTLRISSEKHIQDIEQRFPGFIHMKAQSGVEMAFKLQHNIQLSIEVQGYRPNGQRVALLNCLYSALRIKPHKRAFISAVIKRFEENSNTDSKMLPFLVENLAYLNYELMGEPLFVIHSIDVFLSVHGTSVLQSFEEALLPSEKTTERNGAMENDEENTEDEKEFLREESEDELLKRLPENIQPLVDCLKPFNKYLLLIRLNQYLKTVFNISDCLMYEYSTLESSKVCEKPALRVEKINFHVIAVIKEMGISDHSKDARKSLVENYIKFKRLIMQFDFNRSALDEIDISTTPKVEKVNKTIKKPRTTKRRSSTKSTSSDDDDADESYTPKSRRKSGGSTSRATKRRSSTKSKSSDDEGADVSYTPKSGGSNPKSAKKSSSKNGETTPVAPFKKRSSRSSLANEND